MISALALALVTSFAPVVGTASEPTTAVEPAEADADPTAPAVADNVLPCGLRVIAAQDLTLPVAAVVLAVETGSEDDPTNVPGLVHALAYHLQQGNREIAPGGITRLVHDGGGVASHAIGVAQVRYEALVPASLLDDVLWAETQRLRAPNVTAALWKETLRQARRDRARRWAIPLDGLAAVHEAAGLRHEGRAVGPELQGLGDRTVATQIAERFGYERATLVVVSPRPPDIVLAQVANLVADLPDRTRAVVARTVPARSGTVPRRMTIDRLAEDVVAWPIAPDNAARMWARVWCKTINRQKRAESEPGRARVRCTMDDDPRRPTLVLRASGVDDPIALLGARVDRIATGQDENLVESQRRVVTDELAMTLRTPLELARGLAYAGVERGGDAAVVIRPAADYTGQAALGGTPPADAFAPYTLGAAIHMVASKRDAPRVPGGAAAKHDAAEGDK